MKPIGIILPFRHGSNESRLDQLREALDSWKNNSEGLSEVYLIVDEDENESVPLYENVQRYVVPTGVTLMEKLNYHALDIAEKHDYIQFLAHDIVLQTAWESQFIDFLESVPVGMIYGNDLVHAGKLATHPCIKSSMIKAVGFYGCPAVEHNFFDNYWMSVAQTFGMCMYCPDVIMEHNHPIVGKAPRDEISDKIANLLEIDQQKFTDYMSVNFKNDVEKLRVLAND